ncbi:MAG: alpha/beta fold hydrolase [Pseudomonadota bacterium]
MKRFALGLTIVLLFVLSPLAVAYYSLPQHFTQPLLDVNRTLSGLSEKTITVGPHQVHYLEGGAGKGNAEPLVLLHGIFAEKDHWVDFARPLTGRYRVIAPDLPGFGESGRLPDQAYDYAAQTERLRLLLDALGVHRVHLAGNSMGGTIAVLFAIAYPQRVASVALIGAPHGIRSPQPSRMDGLIDAGKAPLIAHTTAEFAQMMDLVFAKQPFLPYPILQATEQAALRNADSNMRLWNAQLKDRYLLDGRINGLQQPTLVLWGGQDQVFDASGAELLRSRLNNPRIDVLPGVGHLPMMEAPGHTAQAYAGFLDSLL